MADWTQTMQQTFEYYIVSPSTWADDKPLDNVLSSSIDRDLNADTLGSASFEVTDSLGECYIRIYLVTIQNGITEKHSLGTFLVQTPSSSFNGKVRSVSMEAYTPLLELKENGPELGYTILKGENIMNRAYMLAREHLRAPVIETESSSILNGDFIAQTDDTWMTFLKDLLANNLGAETTVAEEKAIRYRFGLDELSRIIFVPDQDIESLQPVWEYNDDNSSILLPDITMDHDIYGIPNVVEVVYTSGTDNYVARIVNNDPNSPTSTISRGREIVHRETNPNIYGRPTQRQLQEYAEKKLKSLSSVQYTVSYSHGYCPVRIGDCIRLNYERAGITDIKAKVISQKIKCKPGCEVQEKAVFTTNLWR